MGLSACFSLWLHYRLVNLYSDKIIILFVMGAFVSFPFSLFFADFFSVGRRTETRFAAAFLSLSVCTIAMTAFIFSQQYRLFYTEWRDGMSFAFWLKETIPASASAVYQFLVSGVRLYLPFGLIQLILFSVWLTRHTR
jgi:hypothetical protein